MPDDSKYGETRGARFDPATLRSLDTLEDELGVTKSEALQKAAREGLRQLGYQPGTDTTHRAMRSALRETARILVYGGGVLLAVTITASLTYRLLAFSLVAAGALAFGLERLLASIEPAALSDYIPGFGRTKAEETRADGGGEQ